MPRMCERHGSRASWLNCVVTVEAAAIRDVMMLAGRLAAFVRLLRGRPCRFGCRRIPLSV